MTFDELNVYLVDDHASIMSQDERRYIYDLCVARRPCEALEVGSAYGGTTAIMALGGAHVHSVDLWWSEAEGVGNANLRQKFEATLIKFSLRGCVESHVGNSYECADAFIDRSYDIVLVDACHDGKYPMLDIDAYCRKVRESGVFLVDDIANGHPDVTEAVLRWQSSPIGGQFKFVRGFRTPEGGCVKLGVWVRQS